MRPEGVVFQTPSFYQYLSLFQCIEDLSVKQLIPDLTVEALVIAVLQGASCLDVERLDPNPNLKNGPVFEGQVTIVKKQMMGSLKI
jgi:hypothetical protein